MQVIRHAIGATSSGLATVEKILARAIESRSAALDEHSAKILLLEAGIPVPPNVRIQPNQSIADSIQHLRPPFVLKALSDSVIHKSELRAVVLNLPDAIALEAAREDMIKRMTVSGVPLTGLLIEEMVADGIEVIVGGVIDPKLGPMLVVGAGGIYTEILNDIAYGMCPISRRDAHEMVANLRIAPILHGARGRAAANVTKLIDILLALGGDSGLFTKLSDKIAEFDLNPVIVRSDSVTAVDARIVLNCTQACRVPVAHTNILNDFRPLFAPSTIAVVGASATGVSAGNRFLRTLKTTGYDGAVFPIHPSAVEIEGVQAYRTIADVPAQVDYAYLTVPADKVEQVLSGAAGRVRFAQVMASGDGHGRTSWEESLRAIARDTGVRIIGPNCMGSHSPRGRYTFIEGVALHNGRIGIACQSGGLGIDILNRGQNLGLSFSGLVTLGNSIDVEPSDLFEFYLSDPDTKVIGLYLEDAKDGRRLQRLARENNGRKPVVLLVGGLSTLGQKAAASHTGAMGGSAQAWSALARQTGMILTNTLDGFLDVLQLCLWWEPKPTKSNPTVTLLGNGGGTSVLATDALAGAGFELAVPTAEARTAFAQLRLPPGSSIENPMDLPASALQGKNGRMIGEILEVHRKYNKPYATIIHLNLPVIMRYAHVDRFLPNLMKSVFDQSRDDTGSTFHTVLTLRSDRSDEADSSRRYFRSVAAEHGMPTFDELPQAISALGHYRKYEQFVTATGVPSSPSES